MHLMIANKLYSSWSLRPWILMTALGIPFKETVIPMYFPDSRARMLDVSPTGKMPCLVVPEARAGEVPEARAGEVPEARAGEGVVKIWESLAIMEYLHERFPDKGVWPKDVAARAHARSIANEMHAGFQALRQACPMNLGKRFQPRDDLGSDVADNVRRLEGIWSETRVRFGEKSVSPGPFLYGAFSAADAMYAPVVTRLDTYQIRVSPAARRYMDTVLGSPAFVQWRNAGLAEPWSVAHYETGWTAVDVFHKPTK